MDVSAIRERFPALDPRPGEGVVHADAPGGTQVLGSVIDAMSDHLRSANANTHGSFPTSRATDEMVTATREEVGAFLGSPADGVVFGPNMTTLTFHLARALARRLSPDENLVTTQLDHDANVSPWSLAAELADAELRFVEIEGDGTGLDLSSLGDVVDDHTALVAFPAASNALGTLVDPGPFVDAARAVGALTFCDAVHAAPHVPLHRGAAGIDLLACSPYKFFGPHAGVLVADPDVLADLDPDKVRPAPDAGPERWQTGTSDFESIAGIRPAIAHLREVGMDSIATHERDLSVRFLDGLEDLDHVTLHGPRTPDSRTPTFAVTVDGQMPPEVAATLADRDIYTWAGYYYALEPMRALGLLDAGGAVRIGFVHYHGTEDVDRVLDVLGELGS